MRRQHGSHSCPCVTVSATTCSRSGWSSSGARMVLVAYTLPRCTTTAQGRRWRSFSTTADSGRALETPEPRRCSEEHHLASQPHRGRPSRAPRGNPRESAWIQAGIAALLAMRPTSGEPGSMTRKIFRRNRTPSSAGWRLCPRRRRRKSSAERRR